MAARYSFVHYLSARFLPVSELCSYSSLGQRAGFSLTVPGCKAVAGKYPKAWPVEESGHVVVSDLCFPLL